MSLDKAINHGKERRKPYKGSKCFDPTCRNHGGCGWCEENRKIKYIRKEQKLISREKEFYNEDDDSETIAPA